MAPPSFQSATTSTDGTKLFLTYNETLSSQPQQIARFSVTADGNDNAVTAVSISGSTVELTLSNVVQNDQVVRVAYSDPSAFDTSMIQDAAGHDAESLSSTLVTNNSSVRALRLFQSAATSTDGTKLSSPTTKPSPQQQTVLPSVTTGGSTNAVTAVAINGSIVELTLTNAVQNDQTVTVVYAEPSGLMTATPFRTSRAMTLHR